jgi:hypothetical protein
MYDLGISQKNQKEVADLLAVSYRERFSKEERAARRPFNYRLLTAEAISVGLMNKKAEIPVPKKLIAMMIRSFRYLNDHIALSGLKSTESKYFEQLQFNLDLLSVQGMTHIHPYLDDEVYCRLIPDSLSPLAIQITNRIKEDKIKTRLQPFDDVANLNPDAIEVREITYDEMMLIIGS